MGSTASGDDRRRWLLIWFGLGTIFALLVGVAAGFLTWLATAGVPGSILASGIGFGGTLTLIVAILALLR